MKETGSCVAIAAIFHGMWRILPILTVIFLIPGCSSAGKGEEQPRLTVSILPQRYLVGRIAGQRFPIDVLIPPGYSPATYSPSPRQIRDLAHSRLWFRIGHIPFEKAWAQRIVANNPGLRVVDTSRGVSLIRGRSEAHGNNDQGGVDPHIWLSPRCVKIQAENILAALKRMDPDHHAEYERNYQRLRNEITDLDARIRVTLKNLTSRRFLVFHPSWSYFARDYGLEQVAIEVEGKNPGLGELSRTLSLARETGISTVFVQKQFSTAAAEVVAREINGKVVQLDPLSEDWARNLMKVAKALQNREKGGRE